MASIFRAAIGPWSNAVDEKKIHWILELVHNICIIRDAMYNSDIKFKYHWV